jgi:hypothetical protein
MAAEQGVVVPAASYFGKMERTRRERSAESGRVWPGVAGCGRVWPGHGV